MSPENLLASVFSWINYDKKYRKKALDYTVGYLELKECARGKQFLTDSAKVRMDIFQSTSNPEFNHRVTSILHPRKLVVVVIGGGIKGGEGYYGNTKVWKLGSEIKFEEITEFPGDLLMRAPSICYYDWNKLILTGGHHTHVCAMFDMSIKKWKEMMILKRLRLRHASVCIMQQLFIFGGDYDMFTGGPAEWSTSVEYLNIELKHGVWQSAPPMPSALEYPQITSIDTNVYLMGNKTPVLYVFDVLKMVWSQKAEMPQNPGRFFSIAASNVNLYAAGGGMGICWQYNVSTDSWAKLSSPALRHGHGALIFHQNSLLLLGGKSENVEGYSVEADIWAVAPYKLPKKPSGHFAFMMDLGD